MLKARAPTLIQLTVEQRRTGHREQDGAAQEQASDPNAVPAANSKSATASSAITRNYSLEKSYDKSRLSFKSKESPYYMENNKFHDQEMQVDLSSFEKANGLQQTPTMTPGLAQGLSGSSLGQNF
jgi:hypothetical protein